MLRHRYVKQSLAFANLRKPLLCPRKSVRVCAIAPPCLSVPLRSAALIAFLFQRRPPRSFAIASHRQSAPCLRLTRHCLCIDEHFLAFASRCFAMPLLRVPLLRFATHRIAVAVHCHASPSLRSSPRRPSMPLLRISLHCRASLCLAAAEHCHASPLRRKAYPASHCHRKATLCRSD